MPLDDLARAPRRRGPGPALVEADGSAPTLDWDALTRVLDRLGDRLRNHGLGPGELVAVPAEPGRELLLLQLALARLGAALLPLGPGSDHDALVSLSGAEWLWIEGAGGGRLESLPRAGARTSTGIASSLALVVATSGSGGVVKAAMLTRAGVSASARAVCSALGLAPGDVWLSCLPLSHVGGLAITYRCALAGATLVRRWPFEPHAVLADLYEHRVTHCSLVPAMLDGLVSAGGAPRHLRVALIGGQGLSAELARRALDAGWPIRLSYGMTETGSAVAISPPLDRPIPHGLVGAPLPGVEIACPPCAQGPGPLRLRGPQLMAGYANPARLPGDGLAIGWLDTADLACQDAAGRLHILGRRDLALVIGGEQVFPEHVEQQLAAAPDIGPVVVVGLDDPVWGARLVACYAGSAAPDALDAWCRVHLRGAGRPRHFLRLPNLPMLPSGKPDRPRLRELAAAMPGRVGDSREDVQGGR